MRPTAIALILLLSVASSTLAANPAYVGTWGTSADQCTLPQEQQGAPMVFSKDGYDQHEAHCTFKKVSAEAGSWNIGAVCLVEGDEQPIDFSLAVRGDTLFIADEYGKRVLLRCN